MARPKEPASSAGEGKVGTPLAGVPLVEHGRAPGQGDLVAHDGPDVGGAPDVGDAHADRVAPAVVTERPAVVAPALVAEVAAGPEVHDDGLAEDNGKSSGNAAEVPHRPWCPWWQALRRWPPAEWVFDCLWASVAPQRRTPDRDRRAKALSEANTSIKSLFDENPEDSDESRLNAAADDALALLEKEAIRRQGVESRLTSIVGFVALASTIAIWVLGAQLAGTLGRQRSVGTDVLLVLVAYMVVQLVRAGLAAVAGLRRRDFDTVPAPLYFKQRKQKEHRRALTLERLRCALKYEEVVNGKVEQLAVAHRSLQNFLFALLFLIVGATGWFFVRGEDPPATSNELLKMIRENQELRDELRGRQGPKGERGDPGRQGQRGARGPAGPIGERGAPAAPDRAAPTVRPDAAGNTDRDIVDQGTQ